MDSDTSLDSVEVHCRTRRVNRGLPLFNPIHAQSQPVEDQLMLLSRLALYTLTIISLLVLPPTVQADYETARVDFMACVDELLNDERKKQAPSADALLAQCQLELNAFLNELPRGMAADVRQVAREQITELLSE